MTNYQVPFRGTEIPMSEISGEGTQLLLVPGMGAGIEMWSPLREAVQVPTTAFDIPLLSNPFRPTTMEDYADAMVAICDARGYEQVDVLGVSWGGVLAITFALRHPERLRRLILASTTPEPILHFMTHPNICMAYLLGQYGGTVDRGSHSRGEFRSEVTWETIVSDWHRALSLLLLLGGRRAQLKHILHKTLIITGDDDRIVPLKEAQMSCVIPGSEFFVVSDGHLCVITSADIIGKRIGEFLH